MSVPLRTVVGIALVAAAATFGDFIWYTVGVRHTMTAGILHGALLLTIAGGVLGAASGHPIRGLPIGTIAGIGGALSYYALVALMDRRTYGTAIPAAWVIMWLLVAALDGRWLRAPNRRSWAQVAGRGAVAAVAGGVAFALVRNLLWGRPPAEGRNYALQFAAWAFAWAPGLLAMTWGSARTMVAARPVAGAAAESRTHVASVAPADTPSNGHEASIAGAELLARIDRGETLHILDVRTEHEFGFGHVPGAVNVPLMLLPSRMGDVPGTAAEELFLYCEHGPRAYVAADALRSGGRGRIVYVTGHFSEWQSSGLRIER
jgi:rhodanese-related sulfurtransferase